MRREGHLIADELGVDGVFAQIQALWSGAEQSVRCRRRELSGKAKAGAALLDALVAQLQARPAAADADAHGSPPHLDAAAVGFYDEQAALQERLSATSAHPSSPVLAPRQVVEHGRRELAAAREELDGLRARNAELEGSLTRLHHNVGTYGL
jgi:hypothetical protein